MFLQSWGILSKNPLEPRLKDKSWKLKSDRVARYHWRNLDFSPCVYISKGLERDGFLTFQRAVSAKLSLPLSGVEVWGEDVDYLYSNINNLGVPLLQYPPPPMCRMTIWLSLRCLWGVGYWVWAMGTVIAVNNNNCDLCSRNITSAFRIKMNKSRYTHHKGEDALVLILYNV